MKKIVSLFQRNYDTDRLVRDELVPGAEWVANGEGVATLQMGRLDAPRTFDALRAFLADHDDIEGIVWHHPDGRMVKIKGKDFGIKRRKTEVVHA